MYSIILDGDEFQSETPMTIHGNGTYQVPSSQGYITSNSPIHITPVECEGHPASEFDPMGETFYCDGSCNR